MSQREEWNEYLYRVKEWMDDLEEYIYHSRVDVQSDEQEEAPMETELYRLKESWPESMEEDKEKLDYFIEQVGKTAKAYEQFQSGASVTTESRGETQDYVPPGEHRLPPLPYSYDALEPVISEEIMRLHHSEHHQSYVDGLNKAEEEMQRARETGDFELLRYWEREAAFNGAGHYLHTIFWNNMSPAGGEEPGGELRDFIERDFGSFEGFKEHFSEAAKKVQGVGWAILVWAPRARRLEILQAEKHHYLSQWDVIPLLVLDVWEHAYYLQYKTEKGNYVDNFWYVIDWDDVSDRFEKARRLQWEPF
ncbi:superoxide dismutase [Bacillus sp. FJAT-44742]|uniref:superoxide dismutase n=1 Tax=Bacillus sp. FJAT-44742 TaxID=2014005 RepID=UPI001E44849A|nr:superoxide dismutase [Bacillus sp. FJAT-44742]